MIASLSLGKYGWLLAMVLAVALLGAFAAGKPALAKGPLGPASCMGQEAAALSPPGSSDEAPGGMVDLVAFAQSQAGHPGDTFKFIASLHEDTHAACDAALEG
jgi:hypothetical protein